MKVHFEFEKGVSETNPNVRKMIHSTPAICRILGIKDPPKHVVFLPDNFWALGGFNHVSNVIQINVGGLERVLKTKSWKYWERNKYKFSPWKPDIFIHTLAHEFQHLKQKQTRKLIYLGDGVSANYTWQGVPLCYHTGKYNGKVVGYKRLPSEIDANRAANFVIKELHREKYLYAF